MIQKCFQVAMFFQIVTMRREELLDYQKIEKYSLLLEQGTNRDQE